MDVPFRPAQLCQGGDCGDAALKACLSSAILLQQTESTLGKNMHKCCRACNADVIVLPCGEKAQSCAAQFHSDVELA